MKDLSHNIHHLHPQSNVGFCAPASILLASEMILKKNRKPQLFSRLFLYYNSRLSQGRIGYEGTTISATLESLSTIGVCLDRNWVFNKSNVNVMPSEHCYSEALDYRLDGYTRISADDINYAIDNDSPVIISLNIGEDWCKISGPVSTHRYSRISETNRKVSSHAVTVVGYNSTGWLIANSEGNRWGESGYGIIDYSCSDDFGDILILNKFAGFS